MDYFEINDIKFFNDENSSTVKMTFATLEKMSPPLVWIAGGEESEEDFSELFNTYFDKLYLLCLLGEAANWIRSFAIRESFNNIYVAKSLRDAINYSYLSSLKNTSILYSPACIAHSNERLEDILSELRRKENAKERLRSVLV